MLFFKVLVGVVPRGKPVISVYRVQEVVREGCSIHVHGGLLVVGYRRYRVAHSLIALVSGPQAS